MRPLQRIGRRQFLHDSALGLGAAPLIANAALSAKGGAPAHPGLVQTGPTFNADSLSLSELGTSYPKTGHRGRGFLPLFSLTP
jgi:hypothetical protein